MTFNLSLTGCVLSLAGSTGGGRYTFEGFLRLVINFCLFNRAELLKGGARRYNTVLGAAAASTARLILAVCTSCRVDVTCVAVTFDMFDLDQSGTLEAVRHPVLDD